MTIREAVRLCRRAASKYRSGGIRQLRQAAGGWLRLQSSHASFQQWIECNEPTDDALDRQRNWFRSLPSPLRFSLITPLYRTPPELLVELVDSVRAQTYGNWELCLAVADDERPVLRKLVAKLAANDPRLRIARTASNQGISHSSNVALAAATGDYVCLLDHDDLLAPFALYEVARLLKAHPECDFVYSDEDKITADGRNRYSAVFKPEFSPEMLLGHNYICHFASLRRSLVTELGGFRSEYDGAQDWDLFLRASERTRNIRHIPALLYHWRAIPNSCSSRMDAKPAAIDCQRKVVQDYMRRQGREAQVTHTPNGTVRVCWPVEGEPMVSVIIPSRDKPELIRRCLQGLLQDTAYRRLQVIVVDNGSTDPETWRVYAEAQQRGNVSVVEYRQPFNYSAMCNAGARQADGEFLLFLNNDIEILHADWLEELVRWGQISGVGVVGPKLLYPDGSIQHAGMVLGLNTLCGHVFYKAQEGTSSPWGAPEWYRNLSAVTGACQLVRRHVFDEIKGFDEGYRVGYSDVVLCLDARRAGYRTCYTPYARLVHHECSTRQRVDPADDARRFAEYLRAHALTSDPYYNISLAGDNQYPTLAGPATPGAHDVLLREKERRLDTGVQTPAGTSVRCVWHCRHDVRRAMPDALLPSGGAPLLHWLQEHGVKEHAGLTQLEIDAYVEDLQRKPGDYLAEAYLFNVDLQRQFPLALTSFGREEFLAHVGQNVPLPEIYTPLEELLLLGKSRPDVGGLLARARQDRQGTRQLLDWARTTGRSRYRLTDAWIERLEQSLDAGRASQVGVNLFGHFGYRASLGAVARGYLQAAQAAGVPTACRSTPNDIETEDVVGLDQLKANVYGTTIMLIQPEVLKRDLENAGTDYPRDQHRIGVWLWELENFPEEWRGSFSLLDEIWAPSEFVANTLRKVSPIPIRRLTLPVEIAEVTPVSKQELGIPADHYTYLFIFDIRSVMERKNPLALIEAFRRAIGPTDKATLVLKVGNAHHDPTGFEQLKRAACGLPVKFITASMSRSRLYGLMDACDCYVSLHRSEGFGLTMAEAMLLAKPVIATNYSANVDFMTPETSLLVDYRMKRVPDGLPFYRAGNEWADPSVEQAARHMRWVFTHREQARRLGEHARRHVTGIVSPRAVGEEMRSRLEEIAAARGAGHVYRAAG